MNMTDGDSTEDAAEALLILKARHKKEVLELQANTWKLKKSIPKADKKQKKLVEEHIAQLEKELRETHENERADILRAVSVEERVPNGIVERAEEPERLADELGRLEVVPPDEPAQTNAKTSPIEFTYREGNVSSPSRQRRRREEKQKALLAVKQAALQETEDVDSDPQVREEEAFESLVHRLQRSIHRIDPDGDCLYNAISHQMSLKTISPMKSKEELRKVAADYMTNHREDFTPFLTNEEEDAPLDQDFYERYLEELRHRHAWGGQLEIEAISRSLELPIRIYQADGSVVTTGDTYANQGVPHVELTYHRHAYGLGEHYNSLVDTSNKDE